MLERLNRIPVVMVIISVSLFRQVLIFHKSVLELGMTLSLKIWDLI